VLTGVRDFVNLKKRRRQKQVVDVVLVDDDLRRVHEVDDGVERVGRQLKQNKHGSTGVGETRPGLAVDTQSPSEPRFY
jgi:hypothetical protein